jgi:Domain of unknown function (DUF6379)
MFEKYMIVEDDVQNIVENGQKTGFQFGARLPYYRGLGLSMVEEIIVTIDGEKIPQENVSLTVKGKNYTMAQMETEPEARWEMGEIEYVQVKKAGGIAAGEHKLHLLLNLRVSYMPFPSIRQSEKTILMMNVE